MSVIPLQAGQGAGTVAAQTRVKSGDSGGAADRKSSAPRPLLTLQGAAERCAVSVWTVRSWVDSGKLPVVRLPGRLVRVRPEVLESFLEGC
jgi:excisionase family DNA binding protein